MNRKVSPHRAVGLLAAVSMALVSCDAIRPPRSEAECILQKVKLGMSDNVVATVRAACRQQFPPPAPVPPRDLGQSDLAKLTGRGQCSSAGFWDGTLYSALATDTVVKVELTLRGRLGRGSEDRVYREDTYIPPMQTAALTTQIVVFDPPSTCQWWISKAWVR